MSEKPAPKVKIQIAPSVLAADFARLGEQLREAENGGGDMFHLDVMDGQFVPNISFGMPVIAAIRRATKRPLDVHLMIVEPDRHLEAFKTAGADLLTVHAEACIHLHRTLTHIKELGMKAGVAINPHTPLAAIEEVITMVDRVLIMTVNPGFGGQKLIPNQLEKIKRARALLTSTQSHAELGVDGGIDEETISIAAAHGADVLVAGVAVFKAADIGGAIRSLRDKAIKAAMA
jgi:ribulose-phosphate 3-epimerase